MDPDNAIALLRYGKICQSFLKDYDMAVECYQKIIQNEPNHFKSYHQIGLIKMEQKNFGEAQESFKQCLKINPKFAPAWKCLGMMLYDSGKVENAIKYFNQAIALEPRDSEARIHLGNCYYELQVIIFPLYNSKSITIKISKLIKKSSNLRTTLPIFTTTSVTSYLLFLLFS